MRVMSGWKKALVGAIGLLSLLLAGVAAAFILLTHRTAGETFNSSAVPIHYTIEGEGEPVVLLHGFAVNADLNWRIEGVNKALAEDFLVISMDLRGHGLSGKPYDSTEYGVQMAEDVVRLLDHLQIEEAHVVGYSLGGFIALKLAAMHPERVVTVSALGSGWEEPDNGVFLAALPGIEGALRSGEAIGPLSNQLGSEREKTGLFHTLWVKLMTGYFNDPLALAAMVGSIPDLTLSEVELRSISVPVLSIVGSRDPLSVSAQAMQGRVKDLTLVIIEGADHIAVPMRREFRQVLSNFLLQQRGN